MKINILIDMELNDYEKEEAQNDLLEFCKKYMRFKNASGTGEIIEATVCDSLLIKDCGFPLELNKAFWANGIHCLSDISSFRYSEMYDFIYKVLRNSPKSSKYTALIYQLMEKHSIPYMGIDSHELIKIADCGLSVRVANALIKSDLMFLQDITVNTREQIKQIRNFGDGCLKELDGKLREFNLWYADDKNKL